MATLTGTTAESGRRTQAERTAATTSQILQVARKLFAEKGFAETSIEDIVRGAGVTRGALYHHYESKADVFQAVLDREVQGLGRAAIDALDGTTDPIAFIRKSIMAVLEYCSDPAVHRIMFDEANAVISAGDLREIREDRGFPLFRKLFAAAMEQGTIAKRDVEPLTYVLYGGVRGLAAYVSRAEDREAALRAAGDELDILLAALYRG